jgi:hypothetical protein
VVVKDGGLHAATEERILPWIERGNYLACVIVAPHLFIDGQLAPNLTFPDHNNTHALTDEAETRERRLIVVLHGAAVECAGIA